MFQGAFCVDFFFFFWIGDTQDREYEICFSWACENLHVRGSVVLHLQKHLNIFIFWLKLRIESHIIKVVWYFSTI